MTEFQYITLREQPELMSMAANWFHSKWGVPKEAYLECMEAYLKGETEYGCCRPARKEHFAGLSGDRSYRFL